VEVTVHRADGTSTDVDEVGEVWLRGPNIMAGYWRRPEETAAVLTADGWYRSGDAGYLDADGYLYIVDRVKDMIISGGENIYCAEVESALVSHEAVIEAAVFGVPDELWGERVHAAVTLRSAGATSEDELVEHCRGQIAGYKLPRSFDLGTELLPKSGAGKMLKRELRKAYWEGRDGNIV
jgi:long-chain acyl-CoA synthetase